MSIEARFSSDDHSQINVFYNGHQIGQIDVDQRAGDAAHRVFVHVGDENVPLDASRFHLDPSVENIQNLQVLLPSLAREAIAGRNEETLNHFRNGALIEAAKQGDRELVRELLSGGAEISTDYRGWAVAGAAGGGHLAFVRELLSGGAEISSRERGWAVRDAACGGHVEVVRELLLGGAEIGTYDRGRAVSGAALGGHLEVVRELLSGGAEISSRDRGGAVNCAALGGHLDIVRELFKGIEEQKVQELRGQAVAGAARGGHLEAVRELLSGGAEISTDDRGQAVTDAARGGHLAVVRELLSGGAEISTDYRGWAVKDAAGGGHLEVVRELLSREAQISTDYRGLAVSRAAGGGHLEVVRELLSGGAEISTDDRGLAVSGAAGGGHLDIVRELLSREAQISSDDRGAAVRAAALGGHLAVVRELLSGGAEISSLDRGMAVRGAAGGGHLAVVRELLSREAQISSEHRSRIVLGASRRGDAEIVEALLQNGPITAQARDSARTQARGEQRDQIIDLLNQARIQYQVEENGAPRGALSLTFDDLRQNPANYLQTVFEKGCPHSIYQLDSPQTIDLGGVTKQFLTVLIEALLNKKALELSDKNLPQIVNESQSLVLKQIGRLYALVDERNTDRTDKFLMGPVFNPQFFNLVKFVVGGRFDEELTVEVGKVLKEVDPALILLVDVVTDPDNHLASYAEIMGISEQEALADAKAILNTYSEALKAFVKGLTPQFKDKVLRSDPAILCTAVQGVEISGAEVLGALKFEGDMGVAADWIREKVEGADIDWLKKFVRVITGREALLPGAKIEIKKGWRDAFEVHTCFNSLDIPPLDMTKEEFLQGLDAAIADERYNVG
jgi:hypothetical protein